MDVASLKAKALEETTRFFMERQGYAPDPDSDEWEDEYRRQFALAKAQQETTQRGAGPPPAVAAAPAGPPAGPETEWPELSGPPAEVRWAAALRATRLKQISDDETRIWLARSWTSAKSWIDTRDLPVPAFLSRVGPGLAEHRRQSAARSAALEAERQAKADAAAAIAARIQAAGITALGLIELVDVSPRTKAAPAKAKLAELHAGERRLRVFETTNPAALLVLEKGTAGRAEYGIERDDGLVADLRLFAQTELP